MSARSNNVAIRILGVLLIGVLLIGFTYAQAPVKLQFTWWVGGGNSPSDLWFRQAVESFNEKYQGRYEADVDFIPGQHDYTERLKVLLNSSELPPLVTLKRDPNVANLLIENDRLVDLKPFFDEDPVWQAISLQDSVELNTIDGKLVAAPDAWVTPIGLFYNKEKFAQAGIDHFPESWDEWWDALNKLKDAGETALSIHTGDTGWSTILIFEALLARTQEGRDFLATKFPTDFNQEFIINSVSDMARLFQFAPPDAIGGVYAIAANNFLNEKTAIMPNGPWMIGDFRDPEKSAPGFADKVGVALYPGNVAVADTGRQLGEWAVVKGYPEDVTEAAIAFVKHMRSPEVVRARVLQLGSTAPNLELSEEDKAQIDPIALELMNLVQEKKPPILANYQGMWNTVIQNETIVQDLPSLALGSISAEEFASRLTEAAQAGIQ